MCRIVRRLGYICRRQLFVEKSRNQRMQGLKIGSPIRALTEGIVCVLQVDTILVTIASDQFREDRFARQPTSRLEAKDEIAGRTCGPAVAVDEWMNVI